MKIYENTTDLFLDGEIWKNIEGYNGDYQVSNFGRIKSFKYKEEKILKQHKGTQGYLFVRLSKNGKEKNKYIHILIYETLYEKIKENECVHHINENKLDNVYNNLEKMIKSEHTILHMSGENHPMFGKKHSEKTKKLMSEKRIGKYSREKHPKGMFGKHHSEETKELMREKKYGENGPNHKLTENDIILIWKYLNERILNQKEIGKIFGVNYRTISAIKNKKIWKYIGELV